MKKSLLIATGLAVLSTSAFATKARMAALSQDKDGSFLFSDTRNVYLNPASINGMKDYVIIETGTSADTGDTNTAPHAEGGFFKNSGAFNWGVYLGKDSEMNPDRLQAGTGTGVFGTIANTATVTIGDAAYLATGNNIDLFFGGDMGVEWGARVSYSANKDEGRAVAINRKQSALGIGLGMTMGDLGAHANIDLSDKSEGATAAGDKWEADTGMDLGVSYNWKNMNFHARYEKMGFENTDVAATKKAEGDYSKMEFGVGRVSEVSSSARWFYSLNWMSYTTEVKSKVASDTDKGERKVMSTPLTVGFEADATSWMTLRGSIAQSVMGSIEDTVTAGGTAQTYNGKKFKSTNTADVNMGMTLNFGKLKVDGMIGTSGDNRGAGTDNSEDGIIALDNLMTRVGVHYWF